MSANTTPAKPCVASNESCCKMDEGRDSKKPFLKCALADVDKTADTYCTDKSSSK